MPPRKKSTGETAAPTLNDLLKDLWQAAVKLRGSIEPADYKRYVLPIIFLRFLSLRYEQRRAELEKQFGDPASPDFIPDAAERAEALDDPIEYRRARTFIPPEAARWSTLRAQAEDDDIKVKLDDALELLEKTYPKELRGLLPRVYAGSNLDAESVGSLINLFSREAFSAQHNGEDLIGRVYEYFIGEFANSEGKRGGEFFTPVSLVNTLVTLIEPRAGTVYDPCCGSGGMFVQSDKFTHHDGHLSFYGQEAKDFTYRLCRMNLFIHGLNGNIALGNTYVNDGHEGRRFDYILANPPFNDGSKGEEGWGAGRVTTGDARRHLNGEVQPLAPRNANTMWMLHFLSHLAEGGTAGFVMASGELSNSQTLRLAVRKALVEGGYVDCIVTLTGQLFANTQIPCSLWFLSKNRRGEKGFRPRADEVLFIDGRKLGKLIPGSRKQKELSSDEIERMASVYRHFRTEGTPDEEPGFARAVSIEEVRTKGYALTPGRYVGSVGVEEEDEPFEEKYPRLLQEIQAQFARGAELETEIRRQFGLLDLEHAT